MQQEQIIGNRIGSTPLFWLVILRPTGEAVWREGYLTNLLIEQEALRHPHFYALYNAGNLLHFGTDALLLCGGGASYGGIGR